MARRKRSERGNATIIRRDEAEPAGPAHGGAWKVAYADFVTAMMAFFLVMWLLNATTEDQRKGLADYFSPSNLMSHASSGTGRPFGGHTPLDSGALISDRGVVQVFPGHSPLTEPTDDTDDQDDPPVPAAAEPVAADGTPTAQQVSPKGVRQTAPPPTPRPAVDANGAPQSTQADRTDTALKHAAEEIRRSIAADPTLAALAGQVLVDITPKGLRVQIVDAAGRSMFPFGSAAPNDAARLLISKLVPVLSKLPGGIDIEGHTDAAPFPGPLRTNFDLSAERANAARRLLVQAGIAEARVREVTGRADRDLLIKDQPLAPANRRIAIIVLRPPPARGSGSSP